MRWVVTARPARSSRARARAVAELDVGVLLVGRAAEIEPLLRQGDGPDVPEGLEVLDAADVIAMDDEPVERGAQAEGLLDRRARSRP